MENAYSILAECIRIMPSVKTALEPFAKRSSISVDAAVALVLISDFKGSEDYISDSVKSELSDSGLCEYNENGISVTGKGAILAKSFAYIIKKCTNY